MNFDEIFLKQVDLLKSCVYLLKSGNNDDIKDMLIDNIKTSIAALNYLVASDRIFKKESKESEVK